MTVLHKREFFSQLQYVKKSAANKAERGDSFTRLLTLEWRLDQSISATREMREEQEWKNENGKTRLLELSVH